MSRKPKLMETESSYVDYNIDDDVPLPQRMKPIPDYGLPALFARMKPGQSVLLKFTQVPLDHARTHVQRFARTEERVTPPATRTEKDADGNVYAIRVWPAGE